MQRRAVAEIVLGLGVTALGAFILFEAGAIKVAPVYAKVGPRDIPILFGAILVVLGLALAWQSWRAKSAPRLNPPSVMDAPGSLLDAPGTGGDVTDWLPLAAIAAGLVFQLLFLEPGNIYLLIAELGSIGPVIAGFLQSNPVSAFLIGVFSGFIPTATILFFCVAFGFGSRRYLRDALIGLALAIVSYVGFVHVLGLHLPAGIIGGVL